MAEEQESQPAGASQQQRPPRLLMGAAAAVAAPSSLALLHGFLKALVFELASLPGALLHQLPNAQPEPGCDAAALGAPGDPLSPEWCACFSCTES